VLPQTIAGARELSSLHPPARKGRMVIVLGGGAEGCTVQDVLRVVANSTEKSVVVRQLLAEVW